MIPTYTDSSYYNLYFRLNRILATTFYIFDAYRYFYHILYFRRIPIIPTIFFQYFYHILYFRHILILPIKFFISDAYRYFLPHFTFWFMTLLNSNLQNSNLSIIRTHFHSLPRRNTNKILYIILISL